MQKATISVSHTAVESKTGPAHQIIIKNTGKVVAFFVHVRALKEKGGEDIITVNLEEK